MLYHLWASRLSMTCDLAHLSLTFASLAIEVPPLNFTSMCPVFKEMAECVDDFMQVCSLRVLRDGAGNPRREF